MKAINENNKKIFYFLFTLLFFTSIFILTDASNEEAAATAISTNEYASNTPQISYSIDGDKIVGSTISISVNVTNGANIYGGSLDLLFDSSILEIQSVKMGTLFNKDLKAPLISDTKVPGKTSIVVTLTGANKKLSTSDGSLAIITAKVKKPGTLNLKTTDNSNNLNLNGFTSCIKLSAKLGSKINYSFQDASSTFFNGKNYEESDQLIQYKGNWSVSTNTSYSGGTSIAAGNTGDSVTFTFNGTGFRWFGYASNSKGIANVYIDGKKTEVDTFFPYPKYSHLFYEVSNLTNSKHTIKIEVNGKKNNSACGYYLNVDKIQILNGSLVLPSNVSAYEENNPLIKYTGNWLSYSNNLYSGGTSKSSCSTGDYATFTFKGTGFRWYGYANNSKGIANIYVDGEKVEKDTFSSYVSYQRLFFQVDSLSNSTHTVKIQVSGKQNSSATGCYINIDKIYIIDGSLITTNPTTSYEENNSLLKYIGNWSSSTNNKYSGGTSKASGTSSDFVAFTFIGTGFKWYGYANNSKGIANIYVDDKKFELDTFLPYPQYNHLFYEVNSLPYAKHTVKVEVTGKKNSSAFGPYINIDKIDIINGILTTPSFTVPYEENNNLIKYNGTWSTSTNDKYSGGTSKASGSTGDYVTFSFKGTGFKWYGYANNSKGIANIYIDGTKFELDTFVAYPKYNNLFYEINSLSDSIHDVKIEVSGKKNSSSYGCYINIDRIHIINGALI